MAQQIQVLFSDTLLGPLAMNLLTLSLFLSIHSQTHFNHAITGISGSGRRTSWLYVYLGCWCSIAGAGLHTMWLW